ncbi:MAG TPA: lamin tail domain-containing protein [Humisphaera sp.]|jgi:predicted extracellular nuclease|nr:lamin tail domain-containing protein [Humisphaera sp.]
MNAHWRLKCTWLALLFGVSPVLASGIYITEFCSDTGHNEHYEFIEVTNVSSASVNMSGWSQDDSSAQPDKHSLTGLGTLAPGQSGIITEATPAALRTYWGLSASVPIVGGFTNDNLSATADSITLFDNTKTLVDHLDYSTTNGGSADAGVSPFATRTAPRTALGLNNNGLWVNSFIGDSYGSHSAPDPVDVSHAIGSPGTYTPVLVPAPTILAQTTCGLLACMLILRRRRPFLKGTAFHVA